MRLGIYGGAFDPVHLGHLILAEQCREQCQLDEVWFVPTRRPAHRPDSLTPGKERVEMLELATSGIREFRVSRIELDRDAVSRTVETLRDIQQQRPDDELFLLIGADSLRDFMTWLDPEAIADLATIVAVNRDATPAQQYLDGLPAAIQRKVRFVSMTPVGISASDIRLRIATGQGVRFLLPRAVEVYIHHHGLYGAKTSPKT